MNGSRRAVGTERQEGDCRLGANVKSEALGSRAGCLSFGLDHCRSACVGSQSVLHACSWTDRLDVGRPWQAGGLSSSGADL